MYTVAERLNPDRYYELARATYAEMVLAGITHVYEFHYVHHDRSGVPYSDANAMGRAVAAAADAAGIRLTLVDACYLRSGLRAGELAPVQRRFSDGDVATWADRVRALHADGEVSVGVAAHSVRAVDAESIGVIAEVADELASELHVHVSEQRRENEECVATYGKTPTELLAARGALGPHTTAVHATHVTPMDVELLASTRTTVCMCPTTERDLADGVGPTSVFVGAGVPLRVGSDSHAVIDLFEEARCAELHERLVTNRRGLVTADSLMTAATGGRSIQPGEPADFITVDLDSPRLAGGSDDDLIARVVFAASAHEVRDVVVAGRIVVSDGEHRDIADVPGELSRTIARVIE